MKICILTHNLRQDNGAGVFSRRLVEGARALDLEVTVLTTEGNGSSYEFPFLYPNRLRILAALSRIRQVLRKCDVIHALDAYPYGVLAILYSMGLGKKVIITAVGSGSIITLYNPFTAWLMRYCYHRADAVTAVSNYTKGEILKKVPRLKVRVINHGVDLVEFEMARQKPLPQEVRQHQPYILSVGALRWRKGYKLSIPAFAEVSKKFPQLKYIIIGKKHTDKFLNQMRGIIRDRGLEEKVTILENMPREMLLQYYRGAELFCLMSQNLGHDVEGFGLVFLEAAASGLPVVGTRDNGIEDAVREGENGFLVQPREPRQFAEAIVKILSDKNRKTQMKEASLSFAKNCQWDKRIEEYKELCVF